LRQRGSTRCAGIEPFAKYPQSHGESSGAVP
jgi:hypothetical protein